jgi:hypothetical protein
MSSAVSALSFRGLKPFPADPCRHCTALSIVRLVLQKTLQVLAKAEPRHFIHSEAACEFSQTSRTVCGVIKCVLLSIRFNEKQKLRSHELPAIISEPEMWSICSRPAIVLCLSLRRLHLHISAAWQWPCSYSTLSGCLQNTAEQQTLELPHLVEQHEYRSYVSIAVDACLRMTD